MKRFFALLILLPSLALAEGSMYPSHIINMGLGINPTTFIEPLAYGITTTTPGPGGMYVSIAYGTGTEAAPTNGDSSGIRLDGIGGIAVFLHAAVAPTAGGKLLAYAQNPVTLEWAYVADGSMDFTLTAALDQSFIGIWVAADTGRYTWIPSGVGVATTVTIQGVTKFRPYQ
jgi:hypothetical protein